VFLCYHITQFQKKFTDYGGNFQFVSDINPALYCKIANRPIILWFVVDVYDVLLLSFTKISRILQNYILCAPIAVCDLCFMAILSVAVFIFYLLLLSYNILYVSFSLQQYDRLKLTTTNISKNTD